MNHAEIVAELIEIVKNIQIESGRTYEQMKAGDCPFNDLPGFDSLNAVEVTVEIGDKLKGELKKDLPFNNAFFDDINLLSFNEAATRIMAFMK